MLTALQGSLLHSAEGCASTTAGHWGRKKRDRRSISHGLVLDNTDIGMGAWQMGREMTPSDWTYWSRVFRAGVFAITSKSMQPGEAINAALNAMEKATREIAREVAEGEKC
jgi:hypothetical protein